MIESELAVPMLLLIGVLLLAMATLGFSVLSDLAKRRP
jgi:hypothetical protein